MKVGDIIKHPLYCYYANKFILKGWAKVIKDPREMHLLGTCDTSTYRIYALSKWVSSPSQHHFTHGHDMAPDPIIYLWDFSWVFLLQLEIKMSKQNSYQNLRIQ